MSWYQCIINGCTGKDSEKIRLYRFPKPNTLLLKMWCQNLRISRKFIDRRSSICSRHFERSSLGLKYLRHNAVPTLNLGHNKQIVNFTSTIPERKFMRECSIAGCKQNSGKATLHTFPVSSDKHRAWMEVCSLKKNVKKMFICNKHFNPKHIKDDTKRLLPDAFPTLYLNEEDNAADQNLAEDFECIEDSDVESELIHIEIERNSENGKTVNNRDSSEFDEDSESKDYDGELEISQEATFVSELDEDPEEESETVLRHTPPSTSKRNDKRICAIAGCNRTNEMFTLHTFPKNSKKRQAWIDACTIRRNGKYTKKMYICNRHFDSKYIKRETKRLTSEAFPEFYLHGEDIEDRKINEDSNTKNDDETKFVEEIFEICNEDDMELNEENIVQDVDFELKKRTPQNQFQFNVTKEIEDPLISKSKRKSKPGSDCKNCKGSYEFAQHYKSQYQALSSLLKDVKNENERNRDEINYFKKKNQSLKKTVLSLAFELSKLQQQLEDKGK